MDLAGLIPSFKAPKSHDLLGFDMDQDHLKIVHVHLSNLKREVAGLFVSDIRGKSDDEILAFVKETLSKLAPKNPRTFLVAPLYSAIMRIIEIPSLDPEEVREIINLQASRHTPYSRSEIIIDTLTLGIVREHFTKVLLIILQKESVSRQTQLLERAGLKPERVFFSPEGICQASTRILGPEADGAPVGIVHMDFAFTSFIVIQKGRILFVRGIAIGANHLFEERDIYNDRFVAELRKSLDAYLGEELGQAPKALLLTGVVAEVQDLDPLFEETLHLPIKRQTYFNHFSISQAARAVTAASKHISFFNIVAPMLLFDKMKIDLTTEEIRLKGMLERRGRQMIKTGILAVSLLSVLFVLFVEKMYFKRAYLNHLTVRYGPVRQEAKKIEEMYERTRNIKEYLGQRGDSLETLVALYDTMPLEVSLSDVKYEEGSRLTIKGTSLTMGAVFAFVSNLEKSNRFKSVRTKYVNSRNQDGADVADFEINCLIVGGEGDDKKAA